MKKKEENKGGIIYYRKQGLEKSIIVHLPADIHKKLKHRAWKDELSLQKAARKIIEDAVKDEPLA